MLNVVRLDDERVLLAPRAAPGATSAIAVEAAGGRVFVLQETGRLTAVQRRSSAEKLRSDDDDGGDGDHDDDAERVWAVDLDSSGGPWRFLALLVEHGCLVCAASSGELVQVPLDGPERGCTRLIGTIDGVRAQSPHRTVDLT